MTEIIRAEAGDAEILSAVIAAAFFDLPVAHWLIGDQASRRHIFPSYFQIFVEHALDRGVVYTTPERNAAALWLPYGDGPPPAPDNYAERLRDVTSPWTSRFTELDSALESRHLAVVPHDHLALLGVHPGQQRRGVGNALLEAHHRLLDQAGMPAYLEAATERNRRMYRRRRYADFGAPIRLPDGLRMYPMIRQNQPLHRKE